MSFWDDMTPAERKQFRKVRKKYAKRRAKRANSTTITVRNPKRKVTGNTLVKLPVKALRRLVGAVKRGETAIVKARRA